MSIDDRVFDLTELLLARGANRNLLLEGDDANFLTMNGPTTLLHHVALSSSPSAVEFAKFMLKAGANVIATNDRKLMPLHCGHDKIKRCLISPVSLGRWCHEYGLIN